MKELNQLEGKGTWREVLEKENERKQRKMNMFTVFIEILKSITLCATLKKKVRKSKQISPSQNKTVIKTKL